MATTPNDDVWPLVVLGAGAAGLTAASFAARAQARTLVVETRARPGAKIRVSGGGRCNVLPSLAGVGDYATHGNAAFVRHVLRTWPLAEVRRYFEDHLGVPLKREVTGKLFPVSDDARDIVTALLGELAQAGATLRAGVAVRRVAAVDPSASPGQGARFVLQMADGGTVAARQLILATGGLSMPRTGSDGSGWGFARALGHTVWPPAPALVPLLGAAGAAASGGDWTQLAGLSLPVTLQAHGAASQGLRCHGDFLFTHKGYSGPVVLDISRAFTEANFADLQLTAQFLLHDQPSAQAWQTLAAEMAQAGSASVTAWVRQRLPRRLADVLVARCALPRGGDERACELPRPLRATLLRLLTACPLPVTGSEGYRTAEVTSGGVPLGEVHARSLASRHRPGLYFAGETLDVVGRLGGFNFLWSWTSGRLAGLAAAQAAQAEQLAA